MGSWQHLVPRTSRRMRLFAAAAVWSGAGAGLLVAGVHWLAVAPSGAWIASLPLALAAGWLKGRFLLAPRAEANALRIAASGESVCVGGAFGWRAWALAASMMAGGAALRHSPLPRPWLGLLYAAIGTALLVASARAWGAGGTRPRGGRPVDPESPNGPPGAL